LGVAGPEIKPKKTALQILKIDTVIRMGASILGAWPLRKNPRRSTRKAIELKKHDRERAAMDGVLLRGEIADRIPRRGGLLDWAMHEIA